MFHRWVGIARFVVAIALTLIPRIARGEKIYDVVVVGGGAAGYMAALSAVQNGAKKVLVLERRTGGPSGRIQNVGIEKDSIGHLKRVGVDPEDNPKFTQATKGTLRVFDLLDVPFPIETDGIHDARVARQGAHSAGMFLRRSPTAIVPIDAAIDSLREVALATPAIEVREGTEVTDCEVLPNGNGRVRAIPTGSSEEFVGRYLFVGAGLRGTNNLLDQPRKEFGPVYPMVTAVLHNDEPSIVGHSVLTNQRLSNEKYRVLVVGRPENITVTADIPPGVNPDDRVELEAFVRQAIRRTGFVRADFAASFASRPSVYRARRSVAERVLLGPEGSERVMVGGDGLATTTPWSGLGLNVALHSGALFGEFFRRAESARTASDARWVRRWVTARAEQDVAMMHIHDRAIHTLTRGPLPEGTRVRAWGAAARETGRWLGTVTKAGAVVTGYQVHQRRAALAARVK